MAASVVEWLIGLGDVKQALVWGQEQPWIIGLALLVLPSVGVPASGLMLVAGAVWGPRWQSVLLVAMCLGGNVLLTHALTAGPLRRRVRAWCERRFPALLLAKSEDFWRLSIGLRIAPSVPFVVQNVVLALAGVPWWVSLATALPMLLGYAFGFVMSGGAILDGEWLWVMAAISALLLGSLLLQRLRQALSGNRD